MAAIFHWTDETNCTGPLLYGDSAYDVPGTVYNALYPNGKKFSEPSWSNKWRYWYNQHTIPQWHNWGDIKSYHTGDSHPDKSSIEEYDMSEQLQSANPGRPRVKKYQGNSITHWYGEPDETGNHYDFREGRVANNDGKCYALDSFFTNRQPDYTHIEKIACAIACYFVKIFFS